MGTTESGSEQPKENVMHPRQATPKPVFAASQTHVATQPPRYVTIAQGAQLRPAFTPAAYRDIRFKAADRFNSRGEVIKGNGSAGAGVWVTIGRKVLIDLDAFDKWIESHKEAQP